MSLKCPFCSRTFSKRSAYSQHVSVCIRNVYSSEESSDETHFVNTQNVDISFDDDNEVDNNGDDNNEDDNEDDNNNEINESNKV